MKDEVLDIEDEVLDIEDIDLADLVYVGALVDINNHILGVLIVGVHVIALRHPRLLGP